MLLRKVREMAASQRRAEQEVYDDIIESGMKALSDKDKYQDIWASLSPREQEVTALTCLGYRSYEIAEALGVSYETVRTHSKHVYAKFGLSRKELPLALRELELRGLVGRPPGLGAASPLPPYLAHSGITREITRKSPAGDFSSAVS